MKKNVKLKSQVKDKKIKNFKTICNELCDQAGKQLADAAIKNDLSPDDGRDLFVSVGISLIKGSFFIHHTGCKKDFLLHIINILTDFDMRSLAAIDGILNERR